MYVWMSLFVAVLFFVLTPGILVRLPLGGSKYMVAAFHGVVFAVVYALVHTTVFKMLYPEGFTAHMNSEVPMGSMCPNNQPKSATNMC